jgi:hypothetical protein
MPGPPRSPRVRCTIVRLQAGRVVPVTVARPGDELAVLVEVDPGHGPALLLLEVCRGDLARDRWRQRVERPAQLAYRLHWQDRPAASTRLGVRVWDDCVLLACAAVLLLPGAADAQGRLLPSVPPDPASAATRFAFGERFRSLLNDPD